MSRRTMVLMAGGVLMILAALLGARLWQRTIHGPPDWTYGPSKPLTIRPRFEGSPPAARVPLPAAASLEGLEEPPCWSCRNQRRPRLEFSINLDRLAPLGDGEGNLAEWLHDFDFGGARSTEPGGIAQGDLFGRPTSVWDEQNPLLIEAEAWVDQATCLFYPEIYEIQGWSTSVPNLRMLLTLARSWVARGLSNHDATEGRADMRRAIRLGRLLRQDSFTIIQEMVGLSTIRWGAEGLYELARREGDATEMVLAGQVMADVDGIRALMQEKLSDIFDLQGALRAGSLARWLKDSEAGLGRIAKTALADGLRPLRAEAVMALGFALRVGGRAQRETSRTALLQVVEQRDPVLAASAAWFLEKADD